jgi:hypothetical protein
MLKSTIGTYHRYTTTNSIALDQHPSKTLMKKLLIISIVLIAIGLGLILYSDPVITLAGSGGSPHFVQIPIGSNSTSGGPPGSTSGSSPDCHTVNGNTICTQNSNLPAGGSDSMVITLVGIALSGAGLFLSAIEMISKSASPFQTKAVT